MRLLRKILIPFAAIYYLVTSIRNTCYNKGFLKSKTYDFPVIVVGNLNVGGTGKSPMVEYLINLLKNHYRLATLSRGYKRKTKGFFLADQNTKTSDIGDEPMQFYRKFPELHVAVDEDRQHGISGLREQVNPEVIVLDDAFQHRRVEGGLNIMLTAYKDFFYDDYLLPVGNLRESRQGAQRSDIVIVTKCPDSLSQETRNTIKNKINKYTDSTVFFSKIAYRNVVMNETSEIALNQLLKFTLVTGIANPKPLINYLKSKGLQFESKVYGDHHNFSYEEIDSLRKEKLIITTEKDYVRLKDELTNCYYLPIQASFLDRGELLNEIVLNFCASGV
ncbi:MAG: tetraacyldisaccharide 4'-kinase [Flavobacteriaceae bacterium]|nr:tetraacyldisaccharide 4'-kinase [Flavobacteriaceae bacterium]